MIELTLWHRLLSKVMLVTWCLSFRLHHNTADTVCRDRFGVLPTSDFNKRACAMCYGYLTFQNSMVVPVKDQFDSINVYSDRNTSRQAYTLHSSTPLDEQKPIFPGHIRSRPSFQCGGDSSRPEIKIPNDLNNETSMRMFCATNGRNRMQCSYWLMCCHDAMSCCQRQQTAWVSRSRNVSDAALGGYCQQTWDGYSCWDYAPPGSDVTLQCPTFMSHSLRSRMAVKTCTKNGVWYKREQLEWTNYTQCLEKKSYLLGVHLSLVVNSISVLLLIPAIATFCLYRDLFAQQRVRIHVNFFVSLALNSLSNVIWYRGVHYDVLINSAEDTVIYQNPVWCRVLSYVKIYLTGSTYCWMFCEGFYLHQLILKTFEPPRSLVFFHIFGWLMPGTFSTVYAVLRQSLDDTQCWINSIGNYQWIVYSPNLFCLAMNLLFLGNIVRIVVFKLHSHPNEPSNFRRGVRAAFMLIPLFGLQMLLTIYRPQSSGGMADRAHEVLFMLTVGSQGGLVALLFCFLNAEVLSRIRSSLVCETSSQASSRARFVSTQLTMAEVRHSLSESLICHVTNDRLSPSSYLRDGKMSIEAGVPLVLSASSSLQSTDAEKEKLTTMSSPAVFNAS